LVAVRIIDSSLLIEADHRRVLGALEAFLRLNPGAIAPPRVYEETITEPRSLGYFKESASRLEKLYANGTVKIERPVYTDPQVSDIVDKVRECIARKAEKPVHMVERGDLQIVALASSHAKNGDDVELIFRDKALKDCLESVLSRQGIRGVTITDSSLLVRRLPRRS
jgi:hypothetical protein